MEEYTINIKRTKRVVIDRIHSSKTLYRIIEMKTEKPLKMILCNFYRNALFTIYYFVAFMNFFLVYVYSSFPAAVTTSLLLRIKKVNSALHGKEGSEVLAVNLFLLRKDKFRFQRGSSYTTLKNLS